MPTRVRARLNDEIVTVLDGKVGARRGSTKIRTAHGFTKDVPSKELVPIPDDEPEGAFKFGKSEDE